MPGNYIRRTGRRRSRSRRFRKRTYKVLPKTKKIFLSRLKRVINRTTTVKGIKKPLNRNSELKSLTSAIVSATSILNNQFTLIWDSNGTIAGVPYITAPAQGVAAGQFIGAEINAMYCDVRFTILPTGLEANGDFSEALRIVIMRSRTPGQDNTNYPAVPNNLHTPIDTKLWDLWYDKVKVLTTGQTITTGAGPTLHTSLTPPPFYMRVVVPCKQSLEQKAGRVILPYPIIIAAISLTSSTSWIVNRVHTRFCYRDP